jgi:3-oxoacyl-[acyl-carrier-protein] synthase-3
MKKIRATITAIGKYTPERILNNHDLEKMVDTSDEWIRSRTGIFERHIAAKGEATSAMASAAFEDLRRRYDVNPAEIDLVIVATITPDMFFPSTASLIQDNIGAVNAWGFDISAACSGFIYALTVATEFIESGHHRKILVIGADTMSSITDYTDRDTCVLFGDGAGVVLVEPANDNAGILDYIMKMDGSGKDYLYILGGGSKNPATHETIDKRMHYIYQEGRAVFKFAVSKMADVSVELMERNKLKGEDLGLFIPHQANKRILLSCAQRMKIREDQIMINIDKYANTTAATIPLGMVDAYDQNRLKKGDMLLMSAFGGGFTWGSILMRWGL